VTAPDVPSWLQPIVDRAVRSDELPMARVPQSSALSGDESDMPPAKRSSVLILFGEGPHGPDLLLTRRATWLRKHAGQPAFPGGRAEPGDADAIATALREAQEETGLDPTGVVVLGTLAEMWLPASSSTVIPVVAWWKVPSAVYAADASEVSAVVRVPLRDLADPQARGVIFHLGGRTPVFDVGDLVVWGFTGLIIDALLRWLGLEQSWDRGREIGLPPGDSGPSAITVNR
jgi:8-oxo-dGTP pyrophosphatase MutT (NUDIX family)